MERSSFFTVFWVLASFVDVGSSMIPTRSSVLLVLVALGGCAGKQTTPSSPSEPIEARPQEIEEPAPAPAPAVQASRWRQPDTNPQPDAGRNFAVEVDMMYRVVACGAFGEDLPKNIDVSVVGAHCDHVLPIMQGYRDHYLSKAGPFFDEIRPDDLPPTVVYPFGGGDLLSALTAYPDALEYTTISLEHAGDPRALGKIPADQLATNLDKIGTTMTTLMRGDWNWTRNMEETQQGDIPGQLSYALAAMVVHGYEPISLRYFRLERNGDITYYDDEKLAELEDDRAKKLRHWGAPEWSKAFSNMELRFRKRDGSGPVKVHRHIAANLADKFITTDPNHLTKDPSLLTHLGKKGPVSALTRAASHLLWEDYFSEIRNYLTANLVWMASDSTGVPPPFAAEAGLVQDTYGDFKAAYRASDQAERPQYNQAFADLFASNPHRDLGFRFGYPDSERRGHLVITRRPEATKSSARAMDEKTTTASAAGSQ